MWNEYDNNNSDSRPAAGKMIHIPNATTKGFVMMMVGWVLVRWVVV